MTQIDDDVRLALLERLNAGLVADLDVVLKPSLPTILIVGAPRSGTTLASQLIASCLDVAYVDNVAALFWSDPAIGLAVSQSVNADSRRSCFQSKFGSTEGLSEPHEFGRFWRESLGFPGMDSRVRSEQPIDWQRLQTTIARMQLLTKRPTMFKVFHLAFVLDEWLERQPNTIVVHVNRRLAANASSILSMRESRTGDVSEWVSVRPQSELELESYPPAEQAVLQVVETNRNIRRHCAGVPARQLVGARYEEICSAPHVFVEAVSRAVNSVGVEIGVRDVPDAFEASVAVDERFRPEIEEAVARWGWRATSSQQQ